MAGMTKVVAKAVVFDENNDVLLIRRSATDTRRPLQWDTPGGGVDEGEDYVAGVAREIAEEVGIEVATDDLHIVYATSDQGEHGNVVWIYYVCRVANTTPVLSEEHDEYKWVPIDTVSQVITYYRQLDAFTYIKDRSLFPPR